MRTRKRPHDTAHRQLSFSDLFQGAEPSPPHRAAQDLALHPFQRTWQAPPPQDDPAAQAPSNAYELRANMRNSLAALATTTALMIRHAPASARVGELSEVMRRQIELLTQQIRAMEGISARCESADI